MTLLQRFRGAVDLVMWGSSRASSSKVFPFSFGTWFRGLPIYPLTDLRKYALEGYATNSVVYACVRKIATTAPAAPFRVEKFVDGQRVGVSGHPVTALLNRPNFFMDGFGFSETLHTFLNIAGECYLLLDGFDRDLSKAQMFFLRPDCTHPVPAERALLGFVYEPEVGEPVPFLPDEVCHIKYPNPTDPFEGLGRGLAPLSAAAYETNVDNSANVFLRDFFENSAVPYGLLTSKQYLDETEVGRIRERLKAQHTGPGRWNEMMILDADAEYKQLGLDMDKLALPELRAFTESRICAVFDVPPVLVGVQVGLNRSTYNNYVEARKALWTDKIVPDNQRIADVLTRIFAKFLKPNEVVGADYSNVAVLQEDQNSRFKRAVSGYTGGVLTRNEARRVAGFADVTGGDEFIVDVKRDAIGEKDDVKTA